MNSSAYYEPVSLKLSQLEMRLTLLELKVLKLITALEFIKDMSLNAEITTSNETVKIFPM